jgi:SecD/SecF fusion protein
MESFASLLPVLAAAAEGAADAVPQRTTLETLAMLLTVVAVAVLPFVVGGFLGRRLRMPDYGWKIGVCLLVLAFGASVTYWGWKNNRIKTGIDLSGGVIMVYEIEGQEALDGEKMDKLISAITMRINPGGQKEIVIRRAGANQVEIIIPNVDEAEAARYERMISQAGRLEFRMLADRRHHADLIERALQEDLNEFRDAKGQWTARWVPVKLDEENSFMGQGYEGIARRERDDPGRSRMQVLVVRDNYNVTGDFLTNASRGIDQHGQPAVNFAFDSEGASRFSGLTSSNLPEQGGTFTHKLGIILDGLLYSAPSIKSTISDRGEITGSFTEQEVKDLVAVLNAGALPATLNPVPLSKLVIGPTLGRDTIARSSKAILIAMILVPLFMVWYYRFSGMVAVLALVINLLAILAIMISIQAAFTLAGLAGLALTVAMAVDNNVLIYERLREERERGATVRMAIRNAFARATTVIVDSNVTTLLAAIVLYAIGTDQVRGFAVALFLGVALSMFTSVWVSRVIFDIAEKKQWLTQLKMLRLIGETKIDFMRIFPITATCSLLIIVAGLFAVWQRGVGLLDIDFTGGVSVQIVFREGQFQETADVRSAVTNKLPDVVVSDVRMADRPIGEGFLINTSEPKLKKVEASLEEVFGDKLVTNSVTLGKVAPVAATPPAEATPETPPSSTPTNLRGELAFNLPITHDLLVEAFKGAVSKSGVADAGVTLFGNSEYGGENDTKAYKTWTVTSRLAEEPLRAVVAQLDSQLRQTPHFPASNTIGGAVATSTRMQAVYALAASWICMLVYLWIRFQGVAFGMAAVVALVHDILIMLAAVAGSYWLAGPLGFMNVDPFKINLVMVAAFLATIGYSVNDTIIVFDRIREVRGKMPSITTEMINSSVNQTLSRTLITSFTTFLVCTVLYFGGGEAIRGFAFALVVGIVAGTYSSIYVASPVLLWMSTPRKEKPGMPAAKPAVGSNR